MIIKWLVNLLKREAQQPLDFPKPTIGETLKKLKTKAARRKRKP